MTTKHAALPLWQNKTSDQKIEELKQLVLDLYQYTLTKPLSDLLEILENHDCFDEREKNDVEKIKKLINENPNIINKNCEVGHITGSALVIDSKSDAILLHFHKKLNKWLQFGGHPEYETDFSEVAMRETFEETGLVDLTFSPQVSKPLPLDIDIHSIPERKGEPEHLHLDFRYILTTRNPSSLKVGEDESNKFRWISFKNIEEIKNEVDPALWRMIQKAKKLHEGK